MPQRIFDDCQVEGCTRRHKARGYCATHYQHHLRCVPIKPEIKTRDRHGPPECTEPDCHGEVKAKGLCKMHYARLLRHGHLSNKARTRPGVECSIEGCVLHVYAKGVCHVHYMRKRKMREKFGMSTEEVAALSASQNGACAICLGTSSRIDGRSGRQHALAVDHDHATGKVRGLLCDKCNSGIGLLRDDPKILAAAIAYLDRHAAPDPDFPVPMPELSGAYPWPPGFVN